jgi:hypothetical protein
LDFLAKYFHRMLPAWRMPVRPCRGPSGAFGGAQSSS